MIPRHTSFSQLTVQWHSKGDAEPLGNATAHAAPAAKGCYIYNKRSRPLMRSLCTPQHAGKMFDGLMA
jgi:hypothetical protein